MESTASFFDRLFDALASGSSVTTPLGVFYLHAYAPYDGRNPRTGEAVHVASARRVFFVPSDALSRAALGAENALSFAELDAHHRAVEDGDEASLLEPSLDLPCTDAERDAIALALATSRGEPRETELPRLGTLHVRGRADAKQWLAFHASEELNAAMRSH